VPWPAERLVYYAYARCRLGAAVEDVSEPWARIESGSEPVLVPLSGQLKWLGRQGVKAPTIGQRMIFDEVARAGPLEDLQLAAGSWLQPTDSPRNIEDAKACAARELGVWNERLQASLKIVNESFPALLTVIADAQSNLLKSREQLCPLFAMIDPGIERVGSDRCRQVETTGRAEILEKLAVTVEEH